MVPEEAEVLQRLRADARRGAHADSAAFAATLPQELSARAPVALQIARAHLRQGYPLRAIEAIDAATLDCASEALLLRLERTFLAVVAGRLGFRDAMREAQEAIAGGTAGPALDEARATEARVLLTAVTYFEVPQARAADAIAALEAAGTALEAAHRVDEALAAYQTAADRVLPSKRPEALRLLGERALRLSRPGMAGEAYLSRAYALRAAGAANAALEDALAEAARHFVTAEHVLGPIEIRAARARFQPLGDRGAYDDLRTCLEAYRHARHPKGALSVLLDVSLRAHVRGDVPAAAGARKELLDLVQETGLALAFHAIQLAVVDLQMRMNQYRTAIEICRAGIEASPAAFITASYRQLLGTVHGMVRAEEEAVQEHRAALAAFEGLGAPDSASNAAAALANRLFARRTDADWDEGIALLAAWVAHDEARGDLAAVASRRDLIAQGWLQVYNFSPSRKGSADVLRTVEAAVPAAGGALARVPAADAAHRAGNFDQLQMQLAHARGDAALAQNAIEAARSAYAEGGLAMEEANSRFLRGCMELNLAREDPVKHGGRAQELLLAALAYYESARMGDRAGDTHFMLAQLYANTALVARGDATATFDERALAHLARAEANYDRIRRTYSARSALEARRGKQKFVRESARIYDLALQIEAERRRGQLDAWRWVQRRKARSLGDAVGASATPTPALLNRLEGDPEARSLLERERKLVGRIRGAPSHEWISLEHQLQAVHTAMAEHEPLREYLDLRVGSVVDPEELARLLARAGGGAAVACVDWFTVRGRLWVAVFRAPYDIVVEPLALSVDEVREWLAAHMGPNTFRPTLHEGEPSLFRELDALVAPLARLSGRDEVLILAPTAPLHALPLHALHVEGSPLIARNPVAYCPTLGLLRSSLARQAGGRWGPVALFGDPRGDRAEAAALVRELGTDFGVRPVLGPEVTKEAVEGALATCDLFHFQGHACFDAQEPLRSYLELAGRQPLPIDSLFERDAIAARLVTLAACESAVNRVDEGDEPLGLVPAFLHAGASAVVATLWRVPADATSLAMKHFYAAQRGPTPTSKVHALRRAVLAVQAAPGLGRPYSWAGFTLSGDFR